MKLLSIVLLVSALFFSVNTFANNKKDLAIALSLFKKGNYYTVIEQVKSIKDSKLYSTKYYLLGLSNSRLQSFDKAANFFRLAIKYKATNQDIYYELGQALYANNDLEAARKVFKKSYHLEYKKLTSLYYMAYISQLLDQLKKAKFYYMKLSMHTNIDDNLKQISTFQLAEVLTTFNQNDDDDRDAVIRFILPKYQAALAIDTESELAADIKIRIAEIKKQYHLDPNMMINGRAIPNKRFSLKFNQKLKYDDNVTMATDLPTTISTQKESFVFDSSLFIRYQLPLYHRYVITPELRMVSTTYGDRDISEVYKNDTVYVVPTLRTRLEHTMFGKMASLFFDIEHNVTNRDREGTKNKIFYGRSTTFTIGQKFRVFAMGDSTIKIKKKAYSSFDTNGDYDTTTLQFTQVMIRQNGDLALFMYINDFTRMVTNPNSDTDSYLFRGDYIIPNFANGFGLHFGLSFNLLDTKAQQETRGWEKTITPSIEITKKINRKVTYALTYDYSKKSSENTTYSYIKQTFTFELKLSF